MQVALLRYQTVKMNVSHVEWANNVAGVALMVLFKTWIYIDMKEDIITKFFEKCRVKDIISRNFNYPLIISIRSIAFADTFQLQVGSILLNPSTKIQNKYTDILIYSWSTIILVTKNLQTIITIEIKNNIKTMILMNLPYLSCNDFQKAWNLPLAVLAATVPPPKYCLWRVAQARLCTNRAPAWIVKNKSTDKRLRFFL